MPVIDLPLFRKTLKSFNSCLLLVSQFLRALRLVNLAGRILLYGPLKLKALFVAKMFKWLIAKCSLLQKVKNFLLHQIAN